MKNVYPFLKAQSKLILKYYGAVLLIALATFVFNKLGWSEYQKMGKLILLAISLPGPLWSWTLGRNKYFTWDFYYGLPVSKKQLIIFRLLILIIFSIPALIVATSYSYIYLFNELKSLGELSLALTSIFFGLLYLYILVDISAFRFQIDKLRRNHQNMYRKYKENFFFCVRIIFNIFFLGGVTLLLFEIVEFLNLSTKEIIVVLVLFLLSIGCWWFKRCVGVYFNYKKSYIPNITNLKLDFAKLALVVIPIIYLMFLAPEDYGIHGDSAFVDAIYKKDYIRLEKLASTNKEELNLPNDSGFTPYMVAANKGDLRAIRILESYGVEVYGVASKASRKMTYKGANTFLISLHSGDLETVSYILNKDKAKLDSLSNTKSNALIIAAYNCRSVEILDKLLGMDHFDINYQNEKGLTAVHSAVNGGCINNLLSLKRYGADFFIEDNKGHKPIDLVSKSSRDRELRTFLNRVERSPASKIKR